MSRTLDAVDRRIVNDLQGGFPICDRPFAEAGDRLELGEAELIDRLGALVETGTLSRFAPMYNAERLGGAVCLCAMAVPADRFDAVTETVNAHREVAHNYEREHDLNMWFVLASDAPDRIPDVAAAIEAETGLVVYQMAKQAEYFIGLKVQV